MVNVGHTRISRFNRNLFPYLLPFVAGKMPMSARESRIEFQENEELPSGHIAAHPRL